MQNQLEIKKLEDLPEILTAQHIASYLHNREVGECPEKSTAVNAAAGRSGGTKTPGATGVKSWTCGRPRRAAAGTSAAGARPW